MNYRATIVSKAEDMAKWNGQKVSIARVITKPESEMKVGALPLFLVIDNDGERTVARPEEVRTENLADYSDSENGLPVWVDGAYITNAHPVVYKALEDLQQS